MRKQAEPTFITEQKTFPSRLRELMDKEPKTPQAALAEAVGVRRQTISLYTTGQSNPDYEQLKKIAEYFNVSTDYLVGLSGEKTTDIEIKSVCEYTGLSEDAVICLGKIDDVDFKDKDGNLIIRGHLGQKGGRPSDILSEIICHKDFYELVNIHLWSAIFGIRGENAKETSDDDFVAILQLQRKGWLIVEPKEYRKFEMAEARETVARIIDDVFINYQSETNHQDDEFPNGTVSDS